MELSCFSFGIIYHSGKENVVINAFLRMCGSTTSRDDLLNLHKKLCLPGMMGMLHMVLIRNLPFLIEDM